MSHAGENHTKPIQKVVHAKLRRVFSDNPFPTWCPTCEKGLLLVHRGSTEEPHVSALDRCTLCGQPFWYTDKTIGGEPVHAPLPMTLEDGYSLLEGGLSDEDREILLTARDPEDVAFAWHFTLGQQMRNRWGLWTGWPLAKHFGREHPDDMSPKIPVEFASCCVKTVWERLRDDEGPGELPVSRES